MNYYRHLLETQHKTQDALRNHQQQELIQQATFTKKEKIYPSLNLYAVLRAWYLSRKVLQSGDQEEAYASFSHMLSPQWRVD